MTAADPATRRGALSRILKVALGVLISTLGVVLAFLVYPMSPRSLPGLTFDHFIELRGRKMLNVMDFITIDGRSLYLAAESSGSVYKVNLERNGAHATNTVTELVGKPSAHGVAVVPRKGVAFVSRSEANRVDVFDTATMTPIASIPVASDADVILYQPTANLIYLGNGDPALATLIDPDTRMVVGTIPLGGKPEFAVFDAQTGLVFQNLNDRNRVAAIDLADRKVVGTWPLAACAGPSGLALDAANRRLIAVCKINARLVVFDLKKHAVIADLPVGADPDSVALDPSLNRLYVTGKTGKMTVVQQDAGGRYFVLGNVQTQYGAHTLTVDQASHKVYVAYAGLFVGPRLAVFQAK